MESNRKVSVIIPTYNRAHLIENAIKSSLDLDYQNFEIVVVDDGSTDDTEKVVKKIKDTRIKYIRHGKRMGAPTTKADGIKYSVGEYILFGEDDVLYEPDYLKKLISCMNKNRADIVAGRLIHMKVNESKKDSIERMNNIKQSLIDMELIIGHFGIKAENDSEVPFVHALFLTRKEIFNKISYDVEYLGNGFREETDPQISALKLGFKIVFCPNALCYHLPRIKTIGGGQHHISNISAIYWTIRNNNYFLKKHYPFLKEKYKLKHSMQYMMILFAWKMTIEILLIKLYMYLSSCGKIKMRPASSP